MSLLVQIGGLRMSLLVRLGGVRQLSPFPTFHGLYITIAECVIKQNKTLKVSATCGKLQAKETLGRYFCLTFYFIYQCIKICFALLSKCCFAIFVNIIYIFHYSLMCIVMVGSCV